MTAPMTPLLQQFLSESRDFLEGIGEKLIQLENAPGDIALMGELFRLVHTLKGNCGLFDFPEMSRVLHAAEDLMAVVRDGELEFGQALADCLLEAMDFVSMLLDEIGASGGTAASHATASATLAAALRLSIAPAVGAAAETGAARSDFGPAGDMTIVQRMADVPESLRMAWYRRAHGAPSLLWIAYRPEAECYFKGEDPFFQATQVPGVVWRRVTTGEPWPALAALDPYRCVLDFQMVSTAPRAEIEEHFRYVAEQLAVFTITPRVLMLAAGEENGGPVHEDFTDPGIQCAIESLAPETVSTARGAPGADDTIAAAVIAAQLIALGQPDQVSWLPGRLRAVTNTLRNCFRSIGKDALLPTLDAALAVALEQGNAAALHGWLTRNMGLHGDGAYSPPRDRTMVGVEPAEAPAAGGEAERKFGRRADDALAGPKTLKVDQEKIDRLMNLIGEMVVAKNGLPYLAGRAEAVFGVRELAREIKTLYAVINRIAEEMQDAIMQVRMMPVSFVFQRFPRLVRDISRKLGKEVELVLEGEQTEADKNIIEALADPLIHIVRNSLDHGIELPEVRRAAGKPAQGRLVIRASQEADRVVIDINDDGKGIDPALIKRKAYEKGIIDEDALERISDQDAVNLVFAAGFSTVDAVSDLSGRGVGMDVVRAAVEQVNGSVTLESRPGQGTRLRLSLPLSMAVTNVMIVESDRQIFGVPMDMVVETVRVPRSAIRSIKNHQATVLRDRIVPLRSLNELLAADRPQLANAEDELATLVIRMQGEHVGIVVDDFREVVDIILKPMAGILGGLPGYAGSALLGDGSVLMVLNPKELV